VLVLVASDATLAMCGLSWVACGRLVCAQDIASMHSGVGGHDDLLDMDLVISTGSITTDDWSATHAQHQHRCVHDLNDAHDDSFGQYIFGRGKLLCFANFGYYLVLAICNEKNLFFVLNTMFKLQRALGFWNM
jgi:hypothetical protein